MDGLVKVKIDNFQVCMWLTFIELKKCHGQLTHMLNDFRMAESFGKRLQSEEVSHLPKSDALYQSVSKRRIMYEGPREGNKKGLN